MPYRSQRSHEMSKDERRDGMKSRIQGNVPVGVLAYAGDEPVGWCSVAPRETYEKLERSRTMPRVNNEPTWTILCFFVRRSHRGKGVTAKLLDGAVKYARLSGAKVVEAYPFDTAGITSTHRGHSSVFRRARFTQAGTRWQRRLTPSQSR